MKYSSVIIIACAFIYSLHVPANVSAAKINKLSADKVLPMLFHQDMFYGADDYFGQSSDVIYSDITVPVSKTKAKEPVAQIQQSSSSSQKPSSTSKDNESVISESSGGSDGTSNTDGNISDGNGNGDGGDDGDDVIEPPDIIDPPDIPDGGDGCPT